MAKFSFDHRKETYHRDYIRTTNYYEVADMVKQIMRPLRNLSTPFKDAAAIISLCGTVFWLSSTFDEFSKILSWTYQHDSRRLDQFFTVSVVALVGAAAFAWRRHRDLVEAVRKRDEVEREKNRLVPELEHALADVHVLTSLLPICSSCKKIRDDRGYWSQVEVYLEVHMDKRLTHGLCPECARNTYQAEKR